ncbi:hypothetical protein IW261DRAFT_1601273 [Armillaria novae-zelandiae]|uniref:Protein kinase domain-containing protein n=1 Tax=Armillaria novae-zelandiae TaxID=153914 RepID=A0AA39PTU3_9AGAR|nr:hypothetical protein IW261DRAFT_1601273 [Armillaria novae-zelandiae]
MPKSECRPQRQVGPSAASASSRDVLPGEEALEFLFNYQPKFAKKAGFDGSDGTRNPAHYDMHLHSQLILKDVLAGVVDSKRFPSTGSARCLPRVPASAPLHPDQLPLRMKSPIGFTIGPESDLEKHYPGLQNLSSLVASTLFAGLDRWSNIFEFNKNPKSMKPCALADRYLSFDKAAMAKADLSDNLDRDIQLVIEKHLGDFLFWEFKSMNAGSEEVMRAISHLAGSKFPWVRCPTSESCDAQFCKKPDNRFQFTVTGHKTGEDGDIFKDASDVDSGASNSGGVRFDRSKIDPSVTSVLDTSGWKFKCSERKSPKGTRKRRKSGDESDDVEEGNIEDDGGANDRLPFNEGDFKKALKIIQQVWAEAVNVDATFVVLNAGRREFIGIRDRKLQRLYLSPLIDLDDPSSLPAGYFKIHTGLHIAALHDVIQRAKRLKQLTTFSQLPRLHSFKYDRAEPYQDKETKTTKAPKLSTSTTTANEANAQIVQNSTNSDHDSNLKNVSSGCELTLEELKVFQQLREAGSLKISWNKYIDHLGPAGSKTVTRSDVNPLNDLGMEVHIMDCYPKSAQSYYCYADNGETSVRGIVVKCHQGAAEIKCLRDEYEMYTKLWSIGTIAKSLGIPEHFGLYEGEHYTVLVLLDSGDPFCIKFGNRTPKDVYSQVQSAIEKMHVAMITHGGLAPENILLTKQEKQGQWNIHIISWKNGQDHRQLLALQKANSSVIREGSFRRASKEKSRGNLLCKKASYRQEQLGADSDQTPSSREWTARPKETPSAPYVCKCSFSTLKLGWDAAVEKDRRMLDQAVWNRY